jgi:hypothetical protein
VKPSDFFSPNYSAARQRFRETASHFGWQLEAYSIGQTGPDGEDLAFDVALSGSGDPRKALLLSSGVHGVEGFFGSAVQLAFLDSWSRQPSNSARCVLLHGLNPYGFAWLRRFNENNVDPNRNFLLENERYEGAPAGYSALDALLNPRRPPSRWDPFTLKALGAIARYGIPALQQSIAAGQYRFPKGLFFGGSGPSRMHQILKQNLRRWVQGSNPVVHLDFHTGLGPMGTCKLLIDNTLTENQRTWLTKWFGADSFEASDSSAIAYEARGGFGPWCAAESLVPDYLFACAEFGTYSPLQVLSGLRAENQSHHWGAPEDASSVRAKQRLKELFCPASESWRSQVLHKSLDLITRAIQGLES